MALVHHVIQDLSTRHGDELVTPVGGALEDLLGGERGSLQDLADRFTDAGLGHIMASWMEDGTPLAIGADTLRRVLGEQRVQDLATVAGLPAQEFVERLVHLLPFAVHRMAHAERARDLT
jgi:uncharacterized protein YidB (DUF937 family)